MGCFDTFVGKIKCTHCNEEVDFYEQTKNYECLMQDFKIGDYIDKGNANYFYEFNYLCPYCDEETTIYAAIRRGQLIGYYTDVSNLDINSMENIEENYQRNLEYKEMCDSGYGADKCIYEKDKYFSIGDTINILGRDWIVESVFEEKVNQNVKNERLLNFYNCMFKENRCYKVSDDKNNKRMIIIRENSPTYITGLVGQSDYENDKCLAYCSQIGTELFEI